MANLIIHFTCTSDQKIDYIMTLGRVIIYDRKVTIKSVNIFFGYQRKGWRLVGVHCGSVVSFFTSNSDDPSSDPATAIDTFQLAFEKLGKLEKV